jgi:hypothetical protein
VQSALNLSFGYLTRFYRAINPFCADFGEGFSGCFVGAGMLYGVCVTIYPYARGLNTYILLEIMNERYENLWIKWFSFLSIMQLTD